MGYEVRIGDRLASVKLIKRDGQYATIEVDGQQYDIDIAMVENGVYSILHNGRSFNIEIIPAESIEWIKVTTTLNRSAQSIGTVEI